MIPILMITHNRLEYTKRAFESLFVAENSVPFIIDNGSDEETVKYLKSWTGYLDKDFLIFNKENKGIAYAMNQFLKRTNECEFAGKTDNDTCLPFDFIEKMLPHMEHADLVQAKHKLIEASKVGTFDQWVSKMPNITPTLKQNHFIGGSGILFKRQLVNQIPETENLIYGWRQFQKDHPELKKAFATDVEIELLDQDGYPEEYQEYYKQTGRV